MGRAANGWFVALLLLLTALISPIDSATIEFPSLAQYSVAESESDWRNSSINPANWTDGPILEGTPMDEPIIGNPVVEMTIDFHPNFQDPVERAVIVLELFEEWAPITVGNHINLTSEGFYDDTLFHRIIDDFVMQGGDPNTRNSNPLDDGSGGSGKPIPLEIHENLTHVDGAIGMARESDPDTAESQFYICDTEQHSLDDEERQQRTPPERGYAVFGIVRDGMSWVRMIHEVPTTNNPDLGTGRIPLAPGPDRPIEDVELVSVVMLGVVGGPNASDDTDIIVGNKDKPMPGIGVGLLLSLTVAATALNVRRRTNVLHCIHETHNG